MSATGQSGRPIAVIAGGGDHAPLLARLAAAGGREVFVCALEGAADPGSYPGLALESFRLGQLGRLIETLRRRGIVDLVMIGALPRPSFGALRPELSTLRYLPHFAKAFQGGDDHLLKGVVGFFEGQGFVVKGAHDVAPDLTVPKGLLGRHGPTREAEAALGRGFALLEAMSPFDVGQSVVVADHRIVAVEAAEGTDATLARVGEMAASGRLKLAKGDGVLVKAPKLGQDLRVDMPAVGLATLQRAAEIGLAGLALRAGGVLIGDRAAFAARAEALGLFVLGVA